MPIILVGTSGLGSVAAAEKLENVIVVTRTPGSTLLEFAQVLKKAVLDNPGATIVADDITSESLMEEIHVRPPMREIEPLMITMREASPINYETYFRPQRDTFSKYQKGRDKRNR